MAGEILIHVSKRIETLDAVRRNSQIARIKFRAADLRLEGTHSGLRRSRASAGPCRKTRCAFRALSGTACPLTRKCRLGEGAPSAALEEGNQMLHAILTGIFPAATLRAREFITERIAFLTLAFSTSTTSLSSFPRESPCVVHEYPSHSPNNPDPFRTSDS